ncbi:MAG: ATP synthase F1 subunit delta [Saccharofermentans sp.]|nr:ATP synthase F1 subunit delta [Saccharofermentans sp.]
MNETGREYATAIFEISLEEDIRNEIYDSLAVVKRVFRRERAYIDFLMSPAIPSSERLEALNQSFGGQVNDHVLGMLTVMTLKGHVRYIFDAIEAFRVLYRESTAKSDAYVTSAVELTEEEKTRLKEALTKRSGHKVYIRYKIDPKLMGGIIVEMDNYRYDGSLRHKLKEIKEAIEQ